MRKALLGLLGAAVLAAVVGGVLVARAQSPERQLREALTNLLSAETLHVRAQIENVLPEGDPSGFTAVTISAESDMRQRDDGSSDMRTVLAVTLQGPGATFSGKGELRVVDGQVFFNLAELPAILPGSGELLHRWYALPKTQLPKTQFSRDLLVRAFREHNVFQQVERVGRERVGDVTATHLRASLSPQGLLDFLTTIAEGSGTEVTADTRRQMEERLQRVSEIPLDAWLDRSRTIRKLAVEISLGEGKGTSTIILEPSRIGESVEIAIPDGAVPFSDVGGSLSIPVPSGPVPTAVPATP